MSHLVPVRWVWQGIQDLRGVGRQDDPVQAVRERPARARCTGPIRTGGRSVTASTRRTPRSPGTRATRTLHRGPRSPLPRRPMIARTTPSRTTRGCRSGPGPVPRFVTWSRTIPTATSCSSRRWGGSSIRWAGPRSGALGDKMSLGGVLFSCLIGGTIGGVITLFAGRGIAQLDGPATGRPRRGVGSPHGDGLVLGPPGRRRVVLHPPDPAPGQGGVHLRDAQDRRQPEPGTVGDRRRCGAIRPGNLVVRPLLEVPGPGPWILRLEGPRCDASSHSWSSSCRSSSSSSHHCHELSDLEARPQRWAT